MVRKSLSPEVTFEWKPEGREGASLEDIWGRSIPGSGNSTHKGLEVGTGLAGVKMKKREEQGMGWDFRGDVLGGGQDGNTGSSRSTPAGGAISPELPALGCGQARNGERVGALTLVRFIA